MSGGTAPTPYQPPNQAGAASNFQAGTSALGAGGAQIQATAAPGYQQLYGNVTNNPYYAGAQASANNVATAGAAAGGQGLTNATNVSNIATGLGQYAPAVASGGFNDASSLDSLGTSLGSYGTSLVQAGFDPQQALYNRTQQQVSDQANVTNAQNGVAGSPFGAGVANQANENFNIDWQSKALDRQLAAVAGLGALDTQAGGLMSSAAGVRNNTLGALGANASAQSSLYKDSTALSAQSLDVMANTGQAPSNTYLNQQGQDQTALDALVAGNNASYALTQQSTADSGDYLKIGQTASAGALNAFQAQQASDNAFWGGIGQIGGMAAQAFLI